MNINKYNSRNLSFRQQAILFVQVERCDYELIRIRFNLKCIELRHKETGKNLIIANEKVLSWLEERKQQKQKCEG